MELDSFPSSGKEKCHCPPWCKIKLLMDSPIAEQEELNMPRSFS